MGEKHIRHLFPHRRKYPTYTPAEVEAMMHRAYALALEDAVAVSDDHEESWAHDIATYDLAPAARAISSSIAALTPPADLLDRATPRRQPDPSPGNPGSGGDF